MELIRARGAMRRPRTVLASIAIVALLASLGYAYLSGRGTSIAEIRGDRFDFPSGTEVTLTNVTVCSVIGGGQPYFDLIAKMVEAATGQMVEGGGDRCVFVGCDGTGYILMYYGERIVNKGMVLRVSGKVYRGIVVPSLDLAEDVLPELEETSLEDVWLTAITGPWDDEFEVGLFVKVESIKVIQAAKP